MNNFNIHVTFGDHRKLFTCSTRMEFKSKVSKFFGIDKSELKLFEIDGDYRYPITVNDLKDKMKLEVQRNGIKPTSKNIEERPEKTQFESDGASKRKLVERTEDEPLKVPDVAELKRKLTENRVLSGPERKFLLQVIDEFSDGVTTTPSRKRIKGNEKALEMVNKKVQVDLAKEKKPSAYTQTDPGLFNNQLGQTSSKDLIAESKRLARFEKKDRQKVRKLMDKTFEERRQFILLKRPVISIVKEQYPLLFSAEEVVNELNRIFYDKKDEEFLLNIKSSTTAILSLVEEDNPLAKSIKRAEVKATTIAQKNYARQVGAILILSNVMKEKRTYLHTEDEPCEKNHYPRIEAPCEVSKLFEDVNTYRIFVEELLLCEASTFPEAILCLIASYFIFNISYPDQSFNTFVIMEKVFLDANDTNANDIDEETSQIIRLIKLKTNPRC